MKTILSESDYTKTERNFYENEDGSADINSQCLKCVRGCKMSGKCSVYSCKLEKKAHNADEYMKKLKKATKVIDSKEKSEKALELKIKELHTEYNENLIKNNMKKVNFKIFKSYLNGDRMLGTKLHLFLEEKVYEKVIKL